MKLQDSPRGVIPEFILHSIDDPRNRIRFGDLPGNCKFIGGHSISRSLRTPSFGGFPRKVPRNRRLDGFIGKPKVGWVWVGGHSIRAAAKVLRAYTSAASHGVILVAIPAKLIQP